MISAVPAALVPVLAGSRGGMGPGDPGRGPRFLPLAAAGWHASPAALAQAGRGAARTARPRAVLGFGQGAQRDGAARLL